MESPDIKYSCDPPGQLPPPPHPCGRMTLIPTEVALIEVQKSLVRARPKGL